MSNCDFTDCTVLSPFFSRRMQPISLLTVHCAAGRGTAAGLGELFRAKGKDASSNYGIGTDGSIGMYVPEDCASWCSSSGWNDQRAVTVEVCNSAGPAEGRYDWPVSEESWAALVRLVADVCRRNGKRRVVWLGSRDAALAYAGKNGGGSQRPDELVMTAHRWFAAKSCPGDYLYDRFGALEAEVNRMIASLEEDEMLTGEEIYRRLSEYLRALPAGDYAEEACRWGIKSGLFLDGDNDGLVDNPAGILTRQDLALVLMRQEERKDEQ
ncbi:MAG: N-acetylmuramoyl-L-alanine amidase [Oscillospiraceae bacterium]|nr:N-acetylmuramoyl-L-alanine amidase [Oscillospiraceae bacterium]